MAINRKIVLAKKVGTDIEDLLLSIKLLERAENCMRREVDLLVKQKTKLMAQVCARCLPLARG